VPENTKDLSQFLTGKIEEPEQKTINLRNRQKNIKFTDEELFLIAEAYKKSVFKTESEFIADAIIRAISIDK
jgi:hypothetical protein